MFSMPTLVHSAKATYFKRLAAIPAEGIEAHVGEHYLLRGLTDSFNKSFKGQVSMQMMQIGCLYFHEHIATNCNTFHHQTVAGKPRILQLISTWNRC